MPGWVREVLQCRLRCRSWAGISESGNLGTHLLSLVQPDMVWPASCSEVILFSTLLEFGTSSPCQPICIAFGLQLHSSFWASAPALGEAALAVVCVCIWLGRYPKARLGSQQESIPSRCAQSCTVLCWKAGGRAPVRIPGSDIRPRL